MTRPSRGLLLLLVLPLAPVFGEEEQGIVGASGGDNAVWVYRQLPPDAEGRRPIYAGYLGPQARFPSFDSVPLAPSRGALKVVAARAGNLHLFFPDGSHYAVLPPPPAAAQTRTLHPESTETRLPNDALPLAACGDDVTSELIALVEGEILASLEPAAPEPDELAISTTGTSLAEETPAPSASPSPSPLAEVGPTPRFGVVAYRSSRWQLVAPGPDLPSKPAVSAACARDRHMYVFFADQADGPLRFTALSEGAWSTPQTVGEIRGEQLLEAFFDIAGPGLIVTSPAGEGRQTVHVLRVKDGAWTPSEPLLLDGSAWSAAAGSIAATRWQNQLVVLWRGENSKQAQDVMAGLWPLAGGDAASAPAAILALRPSGGNNTHDNVRMLIAGLVIGTVMLVVYARRRDSFLSDAPVPAGYVLAPLGRRAVAFLIDSSFVSMLFSVLVLMPWLKSHNIELTENWNNQLNTLMAHEPGEFFWRWMMGVAMFVAYGTIFEAAAQGTPGKLLLGLRVFDTKGRRPGFVAVLLRNLLRVEIYFRFDFVPFALLVALTRNRQRLGDLVAQTVVVQKV